MEYIGVIAGKSGEAIVKEVHKWGKKSALIAGKNNEPGVSISDASLCTDLSNIEEIYSFFQEHNVSKVIFATGHILALELAEFVCQMGIKININPQISMLCNNKYALKKEIEKIGLNTPRYCEVKKGEDFCAVLKDFAFPIVIKSIKDYVPPQLVHSEKELYIATAQLFQMEETIMIEEYIQGNDCSVVVSNTDGKSKAIGVLYWSKAKEDGLKGFHESYSSPLDTYMEARVRKAAECLVDYINIIGMPRVDIIVKDNIPYILEVNSIVFSKNSGSWYTISSRQKGINTPRIIVENAMKLFQQETGEVYEKTEIDLVFANEHCHIDENRYYGERVRALVISTAPKAEDDHLMTDVIKNLNLFLAKQDITLNERDYNILKNYISFINNENPDRVTNICTGLRKTIVDLAIGFLNRN